MIIEDYVSFEIAKLLKEKGFDGECDYLYVNGNIVRAQGGKCNWNKGETIFTDYKNECSAPTLQMAMKWLREVHYLFIQVTIVPHTTITMEQKYYLFSIHKDRRRLCRDDVPIDYYNTYEQSCEAAIKHCLENLI